MAPLRTLAEWLTVFDAGFAAADMVRVSVGVGSYNQGQLGYFDDVLISHSFGGGYSATYDFEVAPPVPTASEWGVACMMIVLLASGSMLLRPTARRRA